MLLFNLALLQCTYHQLTTLCVDTGEYIMYVIVASPEYCTTVRIVINVLHDKSLLIGQHSSTSPYMGMHTLTLCSNAAMFHNLLCGP